MRRWLERAGALDPVPLALRLTLLDLLLRPIGTGVVRPAALVLAAAGLGLPALLGSGPFWLAIAAVAVDGRFFRVMLVVDPRFEAFVQLAAGLDAGELDAQRRFLVQHVDDALGAVEPGPEEPPRLRALALAATWATFAAEIAVALAFLSPLGRGLSRWRDPLLVAFAAGTYAIAPVEGFGWLLLAMGLAQSDPARPWLRAAYPAVFGLLIAYRELPWGRWLLAATG
jgi:hypothetical protein